MKRISYFAVQFAVIIFTAGIAVAAGSSHGVSEKVQKSFTLSPGGTVSLENVNGNLKVTTWDKNEVRVEAVKYADDKESLDRLAIDVDATSDAFVKIGESLRGEIGGGGASIKLETVNGSIEILKSKGNR